LKHKSASISFNSKLSVVLVPSRKDYSSGGVAKDLWWQAGDYSSFKDDAKSEILEVMRSKQLDRRNAIKALYHTRAAAAAADAKNNFHLPRSSDFTLHNERKHKRTDSNSSLSSCSSSCSSTSSSFLSYDDPISEVDPTEFLNLLYRETSFMSQQLLEDDLDEDLLQENILVTDSKVPPAPVAAAAATVAPGSSYSTLNSHLINVAPFFCSKQSMGSL
jgi:hypothetical protein